MFQLDFKSREPIYEQLKNKIIKLAVEGVLKPHDQMPSVRQIAEELNINPNTVQKAYKQLDEANVIYTIPGKGSYLSPPEQVKAYARQNNTMQLEQVIRQLLNDNWTEEEIHEAVAQIVRK